MPASSHRLREDKQRSRSALVGVREARGEKGGSKRTQGALTFSLFATTVQAPRPRPLPLCGLGLGAALATVLSFHHCQVTQATPISAPPVIKLYLCGTEHRRVVAAPCLFGSLFLSLQGPQACGSSVRTERCGAQNFGDPRGKCGLWGPPGFEKGRRNGAVRAGSTQTDMQAAAEVRGRISTPPFLTFAPVSTVISPRVGRQWRQCAVLQRSTW